VVAFGFKKGRISNRILFIETFCTRGSTKERVVRGTGVRVEGRVDWWNIRRCVGQELSIMEVWLCAFKKGCQVKRGGSVVERLKGVCDMDDEAT
jgi:hypothetical protein